MRSRTKPTRNWLFLPMVGANGLPDAACQTSCNEESMCRDIAGEVGVRMIGVFWGLVEARSQVAEGIWR